MYITLLLTGSCSVKYAIENGVGSNHNRNKEVVKYD